MLAVRTSKPEQAIKSTRICCTGWRSRGRTRCGRWMSFHPDGLGFVYLAVVLDWGSSRRVLAWRLSSDEAAFCVEVLEDALLAGKPEIFNTDQGFAVHGGGLHGHPYQRHCRQHGRQGAWRDNVFVERLWRSVKYEEVYLRAYDSVGEARTSIGRYLDFYNHRRPHSSLDGTTPDQAYFPPLPVRMAAAPADAPLIDAENLFGRRDYLRSSVGRAPLIRNNGLSMRLGAHTFSKVRPVLVSSAFPSAARCTGRHGYALRSGCHRGAPALRIWRSKPAAAPKGMSPYWDRPLGVRFLSGDKTFGDFAEATTTQDRPLQRHHQSP